MDGEAVQGGSAGRADRRRELVRLGAIIVVGAVALITVGGRADLPCGQGSIVDLELAGSTARSETVLSAGEGVEACSTSDVRTALWFDFLLIAVYGALLGYLARTYGWIGYRIKPLRRRGCTVVGIVIAAVVLDIVENVLLMAGLRGDPTRIAEWYAIFASVVAWAKWLALAAAILYVAGAVFGVLATPMWYRKEIRACDEAADQRTVTTSRRLVRDRAGWAHGLCLSGGGVRSAVFGLGALQRMEGQAASPGGPPALRWSSARRVTAVSGGAYMAGAWTIANRAPTGTSSPRPWAMDSPEVAYLREHLGYLLRSNPGEDKEAGNATAKKPGVFAVLFFGLVTNVAVLALLLLIVARPVGWLASTPWIQPNLRLPYGDAGRVFEMTTAQRWTIATVVVLAGVLLAMWVLAGRLLSVAKGPWWRKASDVVHTSFRIVVTASTALAAALLLVLVIVPWLLYEVPPLIGRGEGGARSTIARLIGVASAAGVVGSAFRLVRNPLSKIAPRLGGLLLVLLVAVVGSVWASDAALGGLSTDIDAPWDSELVAWLCIVGVWFLAYSVVNPEWWSMAPFYRSRLRSVYALRRLPNGRSGPYQNNPEADDQREPSLYELPSEGVPELQLCAAMTVSDKSVRTHYGIPAHSFTITPSTIHCYEPLSEDGKSVDMSCSTEQMERLWHRRGSPRLTTIAAVAMSGAAVSPAMGRHSLGSTDSLLALANIRLGVWLPNPRYARRLPGDMPVKAPYPRVRINYLLKELFGIFDPTDHYVYITDGGHWENAGLVELVRGEPLDEIVCLDGSGVSVSSLATLAEAISLAPLECGANIKIRFDPVRATATGTRGGGFAERAVTLGVVKYPPDPEQADKISLLWYAKPVLTAAAQTRVLAYREHDDRFPAHGTQDQFFDAEQFEGYRTLGDDAMSAILAAHTALWAAVQTCTDLTAMREAAEAADANWALGELPLIIDDDEYTVLRTALTSTP